MSGAVDPIDRARGLDSVEGARTLYDEWAERYDRDVFELAGVTGSERIADLLAANVADRSTPIVDIGCGTGMVGRLLAERGFTDITGIDLSPGMLTIAERDGVYRQLVEADLTRPVDLRERFGASVSAGTFTTGHVTATSVPDLLTLHRSRATIAWAISPALWPDFRTALGDAAVEIRSSSAERIRDDGDDRSHMVVGIV